MPSFDDFLKQRLESSGSSHRKLLAFENYQPNHLTIYDKGKEKKLLNFASNDYLSLSTLKQTVDFYSQPSSRLLSGNLKRTFEIEKSIADWLGYESSTFFPTGYMANLGVMSALPNKGDLVLMDKLCHASLIDGVRLSKADFKRYRHLDYEHLEKLLCQTDPHKITWVVTESLFSMDGDLPDIQKIQSLKNKYDFKLIVDEAHGIGVYGEKGRGWFSTFTSPASLIDVFIFNFSKAFAHQGGVIAGSAKLKQFLVNRCRPLIYTTATPLHQLELIPERLIALMNAETQREQLKNNCIQLQTALGLERPWSPIIPYVVGEKEKTLLLSEQLFEQGCYCPAILPPTVKEGESRLRVSLNSSHTLSDIKHLIKSLECRPR